MAVTHCIFSVQPLCYYYVLNGVVYQCPDMYTLVQNRLASAVDPLKNALNQSLEYLRFNVAKGYSWEFKDPPAKRNTEEEEEKKEDEENPLQARSNIYQRTRTNQLLQILFEKFPQGTNLVGFFWLFIFMYKFRFFKAESDSTNAKFSVT